MKFVIRPECAGSRMNTGLGERVRARPYNPQNLNQQSKMGQGSKNSRVKLKLVMLFDRRKQIYRICSHNLLPEDASAEVSELRRDGLPAFTVGQRSWHFQHDAEKCETCMADVRQRANPSPALKSRKRD